MRKGIITAVIGTCIVRKPFRKFQMFDNIGLSSIIGNLLAIGP